MPRRDPAAHGRGGSGCPVIARSLLASAWFIPAWLGLAETPATACTSAYRLDVAVVAEHHPPAIRSGPGFADLRDLAARAGLPTRHPPFGFYAGVFGYTVEATADEPVGAGCGPTVHVRVRLFLAERVVGIGRDVPCRPDAVLAHYLAHAAQDDRLLGRYAGQVAAALDRMPLPASPTRPTRAGAEAAVAGAVRRTVDAQLRPYDDDRRRALDAADDDAELTRLRAACDRVL